MAYKKKLKLKTYFTIDELDNIILYLFSQNINITRKSLSNLKTVFESLDERIYEHEPSLAARVFYIKKILDARLRLNINEFTILVNYPKSEYYNDIIETSIIPFIHEYGDLSDGDIQFINTTISDILKYNYLLLYKDDLSDCIDQLEMGNYGDLNRINNNMYEICQTLMKFMRETKLQNEKFAEFDMTDESMNTVLADTLEELKAPSNRLKSGIKFLNKMTGGGLTFEFSTLI